jgi:polar amino acid transport system substrate-binding protein
LAVGESFFDDPQAVMIRQNDSKWRNYLNWTIQELWKEGEYQKAYERNFGYPPSFTLWSASGLQPGIGE